MSKMKVCNNDDVLYPEFWCPPGQDELTWYIPAAILPDELDSSLRVINQCLEKNKRISFGCSEEFLQQIVDDVRQVFVGLLFRKRSFLCDDALKESHSGYLQPVSLLFSWTVYTGTCLEEQTLSLRFDGLSVNQVDHPFHLVRRTEVPEVRKVS